MKVKYQSIVPLGAKLPCRSKIQHALNWWNQQTCILLCSNCCGVLMARFTWACAKPINWMCETHDICEIDWSSLPPATTSQRTYAENRCWTGALICMWSPWKRHDMNLPGPPPKPMPIFIPCPGHLWNYVSICWLKHAATPCVQKSWVPAVKQIESADLHAIVSSCCRNTSRYWCMSNCGQTAFTYIAGPCASRIFVE